MSSFSSTTNLTEEVLSFCDDEFYNLVKQQCGIIALEIIQAQEISSVECLLNVNDIFALLKLDSDDLIPLKKKAGILLNDGGFIVKQGIMYKVETFLRTLRTLTKKRFTSSSNYNLNTVFGLVVPEDLIQKFPFIRTLITYAKIIVTSKIDFTFLNVLLNNMITNLTIEEKGYRYDTMVRQFASCLYILGGRTAYEFVRLNIPAFLPSVQSIQTFIAASGCHLTEGHFNYNGLRDYFNSNKLNLGFCAEDATAVVSKITYDTTLNAFIGFSLPLNKNGLPINNLYSTDSFNELEQWYSNTPKAKFLNAYLIQPLSTSSSNSSSFLLAAHGTDNKFKMSTVISRWRHIYEECKTQGIRIIGFGADCDSRYLGAMRACLGFFSYYAFVNHPDAFQVNVPITWNWFYMKHELLFICMQDPVHVCTKLRNRLLSETATLLLSDQLINIHPLLYIIESFSKLDHGIVRSDINVKDRQNYRSCVKISSDNVLFLLKKIPNSLGISIYLQVCNRKI